MFKKLLHVGLIVIFSVIVISSGFSHAFSTNDLAGTWYSYALFSGGDWEGWDYGWVTIDSNGNYTTWPWWDSDEESGNYGSGAFTLSNDGILGLQGENLPYFLHGKMSADKNKITFVLKDLVPDPSGDIDYSKFELVRDPKRVMRNAMPWIPLLLLDD